MNGLQHLQAKARALHGWLGDRLDELRRLRRARDEAMHESAAAIESAAIRSVQLCVNKEAAAIDAHQKIAMGLRLFWFGLCDMRRAHAMPDGKEAVEEARRAHAVRRIEQQAILRVVQDGRTRRKRWELARIERRIADKLEQAQRRLELEPGDKPAIAIGYGAMPSHYGQEAKR